MKRLIALHPFFFASFASLSLIANNLTETGGQGIQTWALSLAFAGAVFLVFWLLTRNSLKAGLCASGAVLLFFSYGHVQNQIAILIGDSNSSPLILVAWVGLMCAWVYWVIRRSQDVSRLSGALTVVGVALNVLPLYLTLSYARSSENTSSLVSTFLEANEESVSLVVPTEPPDIYYIVLDAYARGDVLESIYGYENSEFLDALRARGFRIDPMANTNYTHSDISIASSLNMQHLTELPKFLRSNGVPDHENAIRSISAGLIHENVLRKILDTAGYEFIVFDSGYGSTQITDGDQFFSSPTINDPGLVEIGLELMLLDTTFGGEFFRLLGEEASPHNKLFSAHRERIVYSTSELPDVAERDGPQFVFAHIISPHVPFVFGPNGEEISGIDPYTLLDARGGNEANIELYRDQLHYLNSLVLSMIDELITRSQEPLIIVLQSDHGSKVYSTASPPTEIAMALNVPILNAIYAPKASEGTFYSGMTPVNTFRQIFNVYFEADLELKPDRSYILSESNGISTFIEACAFYEQCELPQEAGS